MADLLQQRCCCHFPLCSPNASLLRKYARCPERCWSFCSMATGTASSFPSRLYYYIPTMSHPQGLQGTAPVPTSCPCCFVLSCAYMWSRSLCFLSVLVCDLLPRRLFHGSTKAHCQTSISATILTSTAWRTLGLLGTFPALVGGHH